MSDMFRGLHAFGRTPVALNRPIDVAARPNGRVA
jgi:hypothetical protein